MPDLPYFLTDEYLATCNSKVIDTPNGPLLVTWPRGKTFAQAGAPLMAGLLEMEERREQEKSEAETAVAGAEEAAR